MKITIGNWGEIDHGKGKKYKALERVRLRATEEVSLVLVAQGHEALAATGKEIDVTFKEKGVTFYVLASKSARVFLETKPKKLHSSLSEVFTNIDRQPADNPLEIEVRKIIRRDRLLARQAVAEERKAARRANAAMIAKSKPKEEPVIDPEPEEMSEET